MIGVFSFQIFSLLEGFKLFKSKGVFPSNFISISLPSIIGIQMKEMQSLHFPSLSFPQYPPIQT